LTPKLGLYESCRRRQCSSFQTRGGSDFVTDRRARRRSHHWLRRLRDDATDLRRNSLRAQKRVRDTIRVDINCWNIETMIGCLLFVQDYGASIYMRYPAGPRFPVGSSFIRRYLSILAGASRTRRHHLPPPLTFRTSKSDLNAEDQPWRSEVAARRLRPIP
jgi:hypothetical protein